MQLIDSHCHLELMDLNLYEQSKRTIIDNAFNNQVSDILNISVNLTDFPQVLDSAKEYPNVWASVGIHPCYDKEPETTIAELLKLADDERIIAIGECGLDYHMNHGSDPRGENFSWQRERFKTHILAAIEAKKPLIVHTRDAIDDTISTLHKNNAQKAGGIMHCYVEDFKNAQKAMDMGFMISFSGIVSFKSAKALQEVARQIPDEFLLIETDSPYLSPVPFRGKPNQPANVYHVAEFLAELRNTSIEHIAATTTANFKRLFFG